LDIGVPECYFFSFPILPNQETIPALISPNRTISLEEGAGILRLAKDACSFTNQGFASVVRPEKDI
jgi:hypothetical protein